MFIYTPILLFSIAGLFFVKPISKKIILIAFLVLNTWIISSWHDWSYGGSFGQRPFVDTYAVFAIPLAFFINGVHPYFTRIAITALASFFIYLNLFQIYQYHNSILPYEFMTWNKYKRIFLKSEKVFTGIFSPGNDKAGNLPRNARLLYTCKRDFDNDMFVNQMAIVRDEKSFSPNRSARLDSTYKYSADLAIPVFLGVSDTSVKNVLLRAEAKIWLDEDATDAKMVIAFKDAENNYEWNGFYIVHRVWETQKWLDYSIVIPLPEIHSKTEIVSIYVLKTDNKLLYVDDLKISFYAEK